MMGKLGLTCVEEWISLIVIMHGPVALSKIETFQQTTGGPTDQGLQRRFRAILTH